MDRIRGSLLANEWLIFSGCILVTGMVFGYANVQGYLQIRDNERQRLSTASEMISDVMRHQLTTISTTLKKIRQNLDTGVFATQNTATVSREQLETMVDALTSVRSILVMNSAGKILVANKDELIGHVLPQRQYLQIPMRNPDHETLYVSPPYQSILGPWLLNLSYALTQENGQFEGVVTAALDPDALAILLSSACNSVDCWIGFAHGNGTLFVSAPEREAIGKNLAMSGTMFARFLGIGKDAAVLEGTPHTTGEPSMISLNLVQPSGLHMDMPLVIAVGRKIEAIYEPWWRGLWASLIIYGVLVLGGICGLTVVQHQRRLAIRDVEDRDAQLRAIQAELKTLFTLAPSLLAIGDLQGNFLKLNPAWESWLGYPSAELEGFSCLDYIHPADRGETMARISELVLGHTVTNYITRFRHKNGTYRFIEWNAAARDGSIYAAAQDVTQRQELESFLQKMAYHDRLTGLPNRSLLFERLAQALSNAQRKQAITAILFIDLDGFKGVNDHHGHDAGDFVLKTIAERFLSRVRATDTVARTGGDEFVIVLNELRSRDEASFVAQNILEVVAPDIPLTSGTTCRVGASIGISLFPHDGADMDSLLMAADVAMYQAKKSGKNQFIFADNGCPKVSTIALDSRHLVGIDEIDHQHEGLVQLTNRLLEVVRTHADQTTIEGLFNELAEATAQHFATEHALMERYGYPRLADHDAAHKYLLAEVNNFSNEIFKGGDQFMFSLLEGWLLEHILSEDIALGHFLQEQKKGHA